MKTKRGKFEFYDDIRTKIHGKQQKWFLKNKSSEQQSDLNIFLRCNSYCKRCPIVVMLRKWLHHKKIISSKIILTNFSWSDKSFRRINKFFFFTNGHGETGCYARRTTIRFNFPPTVKRFTSTCDVEKHQGPTVCKNKGVFRKN